MNRVMRIRKGCQLLQWIEPRKGLRLRKVKKRWILKKKLRILKCIGNRKSQRLRILREVLILMRRG